MQQSKVGFEMYTAYKITCTPESSANELYRECVRLADMNGELCIENSSLRHAATVAIRDIELSKNVYDHSKQRLDLVTGICVIHETTIQRLKQHISELEKGGPGTATPTDESHALRARIAELEAEVERCREKGPSPAFDEEEVGRVLDQLMEETQSLRVVVKKYQEALDNVCHFVDHLEPLLLEVGCKTSHKICQYEETLHTADQTMEGLMAMITTEQPLAPFEKQGEEMTVNILKTVDALDALFHRAVAMESERALASLRKVRDDALIEASVAASVPAKEAPAETPFTKAFARIEDKQVQAEMFQGLYSEVNTAFLHVGLECFNRPDFKRKVLPCIKLYIMPFDADVFKSAQGGIVPASAACFKQGLDIKQQFTALAGTTVDPDVPANRQKFMQFFVGRILYANYPVCLELREIFKQMGVDLSASD